MRWSLVQVSLSSFDRKVWAWTALGPEISQGSCIEAALVLKGCPRRFYSFGSGSSWLVGGAGLAGGFQVSRLPEGVRGFPWRPPLLILGLLGVSGALDVSLSAILFSLPLDVR